MNKSNCRQLFAVIAVVGLGALSACEHDDIGSMSNHGSTFDSQAGLYQTNVDSHAAAIENTSQLAGIAVLEKEHQDRRRSNMDVMQHEFGDMMGCTGPAGERVTSPEILDDLDRLEKESDLHATNMGGAPDMTFAKAEEVRHRGQMTAMIAAMRKHMQKMMDGRGGYSCGHHSQRHF